MREVEDFVKLSRRMVVDVALLSGGMLVGVVLLTILFLNPTWGRILRRTYLQSAGNATIGSTTDE
uniref:Uncharacterized protein n=1 Tax=viral metagenome TaxID=1070528 RepID=A0A6M3KVB1_9ZZZZ